MAKKENANSPFVEVFDQIDKFSTKNHKMACYLQPHKKSANDVFRTNLVPWMMVNPTMDKKRWPQPSILLLKESKGGDAVLQFYEQLRTSMVSQYVGYMQKDGYMKTYGEVSKFKNMIDMTKQLSSPPDAKTAYPMAVFPEEEINRLKELDWHCFLPCYNEYVMKLTRFRYLYIKRENVRYDKHSFVLTIESYCGNQREWMLLNKMRVQFNFGPMEDNKLPMGWNILDIDTLSTIVSKFIPDMNWSENKQSFWHDLYGVYDQKNTTVFRLYEPNEDRTGTTKDEFFDVILTNSNAIDNLARSEFVKAGHIEVIAKGQSALNVENDHECEVELKLLLNTICGIMLSVIDKETTPTKNDDGTWDVDSIIFKSENDKMFQDWLFGEHVRGHFIEE